jgi:hypothetical protein
MRSRTILRILESSSSPSPQPASAGENKTKKMPGKLSNKAQTVVGVTDRIEFRPIGPVIVDFKTGITAEKTSVFLADYQLQLRLYAALYHAVTSDWPSKLEIQGLDGVVHDVPLSREECSKLLAEAEELGGQLKKITSELSSDSGAQARAASPSKTTCRFCAFRPGCAAYVEKAFSEGPLCENDVAGTLRAWRTFGNGEYLIELDRPSSSARIRNLAPLAHINSAFNSAVPGQRMMVFNVSSGGEGEALFSPTAFTAVHTYCEKN